jgi:hypothetical protein
MPTNIYLGSLTGTIPCLVLPPTGSLGSDEYTIIANQVPATLLANTTAGDFNKLNDGTYIYGGTQVMSVNRDLGIKDGDTYTLNIPLLLFGDSTLVTLQLKLKGTQDDSDGWYGSKCTPAVFPHQQPGWDSGWYLFVDSTSPYNATYTTTTGQPIAQGDQGWFSQWSWYSQSGVLYSLYICDWPGASGQGGDENDDLLVMITDGTNYPVKGAPS